jgi:hypothetical protein
VRPSNLATPADLARLRGGSATGARRAQPERQFTDRVKRYARRGGWLPFHALRSKGSDPGFPDLILMRANRLVAAELKIPPNATTAWQECWLTGFATLGMLAGPHLSIESYVWWPDQMSEIERILL